MGSSSPVCRPPINRESLRVAIVGGGLAGLAAVVAASARGFQVELFERAASLGGRAGAVFDRAIGSWVDNCQHVSMGCCTNLADFYRRIGSETALEPLGALHFLDSSGRDHPFLASEWFPAPLHLTPALWGLRYLSVADRLRIMRAVSHLVRQASGASPTDPTIADWLRRNGQSEAVMRRFWSVVLVGALGESIETASLSAAVKIFRDGFFAARAAHHVARPRVSLRELHHDRPLAWLQDRGVAVHLRTTVRRIDPPRPRNSRLRLTTRSGSAPEFDAVIVAAPWHACERFLVQTGDFAWIHDIRQLSASPIVCVHLWFDRPIARLPHAVLIDRGGDWLFGPEAAPAAGGLWHYQVVSSAARQIVGLSRETILNRTLTDLQSLGFDARDARLAHHRVMRWPRAVFSMEPGVDAWRPGPVTARPNLFLAGDWTATGWPATMEGAVRSGYRAVESLVRWADGAAATPEPIVVGDLPVAQLAAWWLGHRRDRKQ